MIDDLKVVAHDVEGCSKRPPARLAKIACAPARRNRASAQTFVPKPAMRRRPAAAADAATSCATTRQAVGIAAGVAFLINYLIGRR